MAKISIIIPVYNEEKYLKECLDSAVNQTLQDIEIICVNDGSTDKSRDILDEYSAMDKRIKVLHQKKQYAGAARNNGMKIASGDYLLIFDSDDILLPDMCEKMYNEAVKKDLDITICRSTVFDTASGAILPSKSIWDEYLPEKNVFNYKDMKEHIYGFCIGWAWDKLYKRSFIQKNNLEFQNIRCSNDMFFVFHSLVLADRISVMEDILTRHRECVQTSISKTRDKHPLEFIKAIYLLKETLETEGVYEDVKQSFINWNIDWCFWHITTLKTPRARKILENKLKKDVFKMLEVYSFPKDYFYRPQNYHRIRQKHFCSISKWYQNIFSVYNKCQGGKVYKVLCILGIKIKSTNKRRTRKLKAELSKIS